MDRGLLKYAQQLKEEAYRLYVPNRSYDTNTDRKRYAREVMNYIASELQWCYPRWGRYDIGEIREIIGELFHVSNSTITRILKPKKYYKTDLESEMFYWDSHLFDKMTVHKVRTAEWYKQQEGQIALLALQQIEINGETVRWKAERFETKQALFGQQVTIVSAEPQMDSVYRIAQDGGQNLWHKYELMGEYYE